MNNCIKDIALECIVETINESGYWVFNNAELEKFAELIVRECGEFCGYDPTGVKDMFKYFGITPV